MRDTYADTSLRAGGSGFAPRCRSKKGSKRSIDGCRQYRGRLMRPHRDSGRLSLLRARVSAASS